MKQINEMNIGKIIRKTILKEDMVTPNPSLNDFSEKSEMLNSLGGDDSENPVQQISSEEILDKIKTLLNNYYSTPKENWTLSS